MSQDEGVNYERLSVEAVQQLHRRFMEKLDKRVEGAVSVAREQGNKEERLPELLKTLLLELARRRMDIRKKDLEAAAVGGYASIVLGIEKLPAFSPFSFRQKWALAKAEKERQETQTVQDVFAGEDRIYLRFKVDQTMSITQKSVKTALCWKGYQVVDYKKGIATDGKQKFRIGKILEDCPTLLEDFRDDPVRAGGNLLAVISRRPGDIALMSTNRAWRSCMSHDGMFFNDCVPNDIREGTLIAYMVSENDPEINNPLGRLLIKPYERENYTAVEGHGFIYRCKLAFKKALSKPPGKVDDNILYFCEPKMYGLSNNSFKSVVEKFVSDNLLRNQEGDFYLSGKLYTDASCRFIERKGGVVREKGFCRGYDILY